MRSVIKALLLTMVLALVSCRMSPSAPPKPAKVPAAAIWVGGADGGVFLVVGKNASDPKDVYDVVVYNDYTGDIWFKGKLRLNSGEIEPRAYRDPNFFSGWDGDRLYLLDGRQLTAIPKGSAKGQ